MIAQKCIFRMSEMLNFSYKLFLLCTGTKWGVMNKKIKIIYVDDDSFVRKAIAEYLRKELFEVIETKNGEEFKKSIKAESGVDLVLLDMILPDCDGMTLLSEVKNTTNIASIILSSRSEDIDRIIGIEAGADDYLPKPVSPRELKARIHAVLRRMQPQTDSPKLTEGALSFDQWIIDPSQYQVFSKEGVSAGLTTSEFLILYNLALSAKKVLTRDHLFEITRQINSDTHDRAVDVQITRIRKKISDTAKNSKYIKTIRGVGYLFCGEIST